MAKENTNLTDIAATVLATAGNSVPGSMSEKLMELLYRRLAKEEAETQETENNLKAAQKAGMESQILRRKTELEKQSQCPHKKPYGESALVGQRLHSHKYLYLCQYCSKEWHDNEVPLDLRISSEIVGGPNF